MKITYTYDVRMTVEVEFEDGIDLDQLVADLPAAFDELDGYALEGTVNDDTWTGDITVAAVKFVQEGTRLGVPGS